MVPGVYNGFVSESTAPPVSRFGELLRSFRLHAGLSQQHLADRAGISLAAVSALERGTRHSPQRATFDLLASALGLSEAQREAWRRSATRVRVPNGSSPVENTLPRYMTSFVGREAELEELQAMLERRGIVSIVGAGGLGKTRLACELAQRVAPTYARAWFADLVPLGDAAALQMRLAALAGVVARNGSDAVQALSASFRDQRTLLVLDNCERLIADVAAVVETISRIAPSTSILVTSRERLAIPGESIFRLEPLSTRDAVALAPATQLFVDRATDADRRFVMTPKNESQVRDICARLDGVPLAIELAAARIGSFGLTNLCERLDQQFALPGAVRGSPDRHATMQAAIEWSVATLTSAEQTMLRRCAVFNGGFTVDAVERVCCDDPLDRSRAISLLLQLAEKSLIAVEPLAGRYTMLVTVRTFALHELQAAGEFDTIARKHAAWIADIADIAGREIRIETTARPIVEKMSADVENMRSALERFAEDDDLENVRVAARVLGGFRSLWINLGMHDEARRWAVSLLPRLTPADDRIAVPLMRLLVQISGGAAYEEVSESARILFTRAADEDSLASLYLHSISHYTLAYDIVRARLAAEDTAAILARNATLSTRLEPLLLLYRSYLSAITGNHAEAVAYDAAAAGRITGPTALTVRAAVAYANDRYDEAAAFLREALVAEPRGPAPLGHANLLADLAIVAEAADDDAEAATLIEACLSESYVTLPYVFAEALVAIASFSLRHGRPEDAALLQGFADALRRRAGRGGSLFSRRLNERLSERLANDLTPPAYASITARGAQMELHEAIELARAATGFDTRVREGRLS